MTETPRLYAKDSAGFAGVWREVHFEEWTGRISAAQIRARHEKRGPLITSLPAGRKIITISIVHDASIAPLDKEQRKAVDEGVAQLENRTRAAAVMIGASGFKAVIIRSIVTALMMVQREQHPTKIFGNLDEAFAWLGPMLEADGGKPLGARELAAAHQELLALAARAS